MEIKSRGAAVPAGNTPLSGYCIKVIPRQHRLKDDAPRGWTWLYLLEAGEEKQGLAIIGSRHFRHGPVCIKFPVLATRGRGGYCFFDVRMADRQRYDDLSAGRVIGIIAGRK